MRSRKTTIEPKYAVSFIFHFFIILFIGISISGSLIVIFLNRKIGPTYLEGISALSRLRASLPQILFITAFVQALTLSAIVMFLALLWSHRIAGPLVRFRKFLLEFAKGNPPKEPIAFRDTDQLQGLVQAFSEMVITHRDNSVKALTLLVEAQRILDECETLEKQAKTDRHQFALKLKELEKIYLRIKDIYTAKPKINE